MSADFWVLVPMVGSLLVTALAILLFITLVPISVRAGEVRGETPPSEIGSSVTADDASEGAGG